MTCSPYVLDSFHDLLHFLSSFLSQRLSTAAILMHLVSMRSKDFCLEVLAIVSSHTRSTTTTSTRSIRTLKIKPGFEKLLDVSMPPLFPIHTATFRPREQLVFTCVRCTKVRVRSHLVCTIKHLTMKCICHAWKFSQWPERFWTRRCWEVLRWLRTDMASVEETGRVVGIQSILTKCDGILKICPFYAIKYGLLRCQSCCRICERLDR